MGATLIPAGIVLGGIASVVLVFLGALAPMSSRLPEIGKPFARDLDIAGLDIRPDGLVYAMIGVVAVMWIALVALTRPAPLAGLLELAAVAGFSLTATKLYLRLRCARRIRRFGEQLENVLRMFSGAVRVGLGLRQALAHVAEQSDEPARRELTRVVGSTNLGVSLVDALDEMARRMALPETGMLSRVIRVQTQTGSDLAGVLQGLADTIRDRRRFGRKVRAMTSQGRATAWVLGALPIGIGCFIFLTQPALRGPWIGTSLGRVLLFAALALDALAIVILMRITRIEA